MKIKKVKAKTQLDYLKSIRKAMPKPSFAFQDRRTKLKNKAQKKDVE